MAGLLVLLTAIPALALGGPAVDALVRNGRLLENWKADPEHYARLVRDLRVFWTEPPARREQLRKLDRDLAALDALTQKRLWEVMESYSLWLDHLPEAERKSIEAADHQERLRLIRQIKERQLIERLPVRVREDLQAVPEERRTAEIARLRQEERQRRQPWLNLLRQRYGPPARPARPTRLREFPDDVQTFVSNTLLPRLSNEERDHLKKAEGKWPDYPRLLQELAEHHPVLPPLHGSVGYLRYKDFPSEIKSMLPRKRPETQGQWTALGKLEGRWPDYALAVNDLLRKEGKTPPQPLGACRPEHFANAVQAVLMDKLRPQLSDSERNQLDETEGKWPEYPRLLHELAHKHEVYLPDLSLPGPRELWENVR